MLKPLAEIHTEPVPTFRAADLYTEITILLQPGRQYGSNYLGLANGNSMMAVGRRGAWEWNVLEPFTTAFKPSKTC